MSEARHVRIHGRVQGVFFRDSMRRRAQAREVVGWVRNDPDGTVEAWLEGPEEDLDALERWIRDGGPSRARVTEVETGGVPPRGLEGFEIRR